MRKSTGACGCISPLGFIELVRWSSSMSALAIPFGRLLSLSLCRDFSETTFTFCGASFGNRHLW